MGSLTKAELEKKLAELKKENTGLKKELAAAERTPPQEATAYIVVNRDAGTVHTVSGDLASAVNDADRLKEKNPDEDWVVVSA